MRRMAFILLLLLLLPNQVPCQLTEGSKIGLFAENIEPTSQFMQAENVCVMYNICGTRKDGKFLNCANTTLAAKPDALLSSKIQSLCPTITGDVCCSAEQFDVLRSQVQQVVPFLVGCPACLRNFLNLFCELSCSPNQSSFINITSTKQEGDTFIVKAVDFYVTEEFAEMLYDSCKDVKFGAMNTRAMDFIGGGAKNPEELLSFLGKEADLYEPGSPFSIHFTTSLPHRSVMRPLNGSIVPCWDSSLSCSCGDCPSASFCSDTTSAANTSSHCSLAIGSIHVRCTDFALSVLYVLVLLGMCVSAIVTYSWKKGKQQSMNENLLYSEEYNELSSQQDDDVASNPPQVVANETDEKLLAHQSYVHTFLSGYFRAHGMWVANHSGLVLLSAAIIMVLLCLGLIRLNVETDPEKLWVSPGSRAAAEKEFFDTHLAPFYRIEQVILATTPPAGSKESPSIVTDENILLLFQMQKKIDDLRGNNSGLLVSLNDICMKPVGSACATQSVLQYFKMDSQLFEDYDGATHALFCFEHYSSSEPCFSAYQAPVDPSTVLGGFSGNNYSQATAFVVTYLVKNGIQKYGESNDAAIAWEKAFILLAKEELTKMAKLRNLTLAFSSEGSIQAELKRESTADVPTIMISYLVMFAYISLTLGDFSPSVAPFYVTSKVLLALSGVIIVALSVLGSVGLFSAFGVRSTLIIAEVIPFLVLAVGVDNMCIIVHALKREDGSLPLDVQIGNAIAEVGPSITFASLAEVLAFAIGTITPMPACRVFSMFAALAVFLDYVLQITAFVALLTFDMKRTQENRIDCFPCFISAQDEQEELTTAQRNYQDPSLLVQYMQRIHAPFLQIQMVKAIVVAVFVGLVFASIALTTRIPIGLNQQVVLPRDSYLQGYFDNLTEYLRVGPPLYFVVKDYNYSLFSNQTNLLCSISQCNPNSLLNQVSQASQNPEKTFIAKPAASWLDDFLVWLSPDAFGCCRKFPNGHYCPPDDQPPCCAEDDDYCGLISETCKDCTTCFLHSDLHEGRPSTEQFKEKLPWFLSALPSSDCSKGGVGAYSNSVDLRGFENGIISASEFRTYHTPLNKQSDYVNSMKAARDFTSRVSKSLQISLFPYSVAYIFFEQYLDIWRTTLISLILALGTVFIVSLLFTSSLWTSGIIILILAMIVIDILGLMALMDIQLNAISVVNLVMSVGIAVEFCVHLTHAFRVSTGNRSERVTRAITTMGASVFSGITITKLVGVLVLYFSRSKIFEVYYFRMYLALVILGFLHGLVFLPVLLNICGPPPYEDGKSSQTRTS